jgi:hypothetical protein
MASVASVASVAAPGARAQINDRITSASNLFDVQCHVKSLSQRNAAQPTVAIPQSDPTPILTEFYGPAKGEAKKPEPKRGAPERATPQAAVPANTSSAQ